MTTNNTDSLDHEQKDKPEQQEKEPEETTFKCRFCGKIKRLGDMRKSDMFFPAALICSECEKKLR
jgi:transcription elongation factor Elf1